MWPINLDGILEALPLERASFSWKYLGLPLLIWQLRKADFQHLEDKVAHKIRTWDGNFYHHDEAHLTSQVCPRLSIHPHLAPCITSRKLSEFFLWAASGKVSSCKGKVNWKIVCRPKNVGGLVFSTPNFFAGALRLWWPWIERNNASKILVGVTPQNRHLADYSDHATIYMISLWKRTTKRLVHVAACTWCGWNRVATVTQVHDGTHIRIYNITTKTPWVKISKYTYKDPNHT
jgi:hypothetical protein